MASHSSSSPARIAYYDDSLRSGGTTRYLTEILQGLDRRRFEPVFIAPYPRPWHDDLRALEVPVHTLGALPSEPDAAALGLTLDHNAHPEPPPKTRMLPFWLGAVWEVRNIAPVFRHFEVQLVHSNNAGNEVAPIAARLAGAPRLVTTWHITPDYDLEQVYSTIHHHLLGHISMRMSDHSIAVSQATKQSWMRQCRLGSNYEPRITVIHNGVDLAALTRQHSLTEARQALGIPTDAVVIGSAGRLDRIKGYDVLLNAAAELVTREPRLHVVIAGQGPQYGALLAQARTLGLGERVHLVGFLRDIRRALETMDIYVQPSRREAHGIATVEACGFGVPVVASDVGGLPETVSDGVTGLLVPIEDAQGLAEAIGRLLSDPALRLRLTNAAQERVRERFTLAHMVERTMVVYDQVLAQPPDPWF